MRVKREPIVWVLVLLAVAGLAYDAYVHLDLAPGYDAIKKDVSQGTLFRIEAGAAIVAALALVVSDSRWAWLFAGAVGLGGAAAVVLYRYVEIGPIGPLPGMFEPVWYFEKTWSAIAEAGVGVVAAVRLALLHRTSRGTDIRA